MSRCATCAYYTVYMHYWFLHQSAACDRMKTLPVEPHHGFLLLVTRVGIHEEATTFRFTSLHLCGYCISAFSALTLLVGRQEGHPACKKLSGEELVWYLSGVRCRLAYVPADAIATHCLLLQ